MEIADDRDVDDDAPAAINADDIDPLDDDCNDAAVELTPIENGPNVFNVDSSVKSVTSSSVMALSFAASSTDIVDVTSTGLGNDVTTGVTGTGEPAGGSPSGTSSTVTTPVLLLLLVA